MSNPKNLTFAIRKIDGEWQGAIVAEGRFIKAITTTDLYGAVTKNLIQYLLSDQPDDTEIGINISTIYPGDNNDK